MIDFHFHPSPNPLKVAIFLEESGLPYRLVPVDTFRGEQHRPEFLALNPNAKVPVVVDEDGRAVFDSNAILLHLAERAGRFLPADAGVRGELLSWLFFVASGVGPYTGQAIHFAHHAPDRLAYPTERYRREALRHWRILDDRLASRRHLLGDEYTIADMAAFGWANFAPYAIGQDAFDRLANLARWAGEVRARPAVARALDLGADMRARMSMDDEARRNLFGPEARLAA